MKKSILALLLVSFVITLGNAQTIETKKRFGGLTFFQDGKPLTYNDLTTIMKTNDEAYQLIKKSKSNNGLAGVLGGIGGGLVGWPLGTAIGGGDPNWTLAAIGAGLIVVSIPISAGVNKNAQKAVDIYNNELSQIENKRLPQFSLISSQGQIGCLMQF